LITSIFVDAELILSSLAYWLYDYFSSKEQGGTEDAELQNRISLPARSLASYKFWRGDL